MIVKLVLGLNPSKFGKILEKIVNYLNYQKPIFYYTLILSGKFTEWLRCVAADHNTGVQIPHLPFIITIF